MKKLLFIVNPISGIGKQKKIEQLIEANLDHTLFDYEVVYTEYPHHGKDLARQAITPARPQGAALSTAESNQISEKSNNNAIPDAIIAVGGDGSVNDVVSGLLDPQFSILNSQPPTLGIIPCGSGNGLARNLGISLNPAHAIQMINRFHVAEIDTIQLSSQQLCRGLRTPPSQLTEVSNNSTTQQRRPIASIAGIGFDARVARRMKLAKVRGLQAYAKIIAEDYFTYKEHTYRLNIDGKEIERQAWFISLANSNQFGYNTTIAPLAKLDDGLIDVCIVDRIPFHHLALTAPLLYLNHFELSQHVEYFKAREVTVYNNEEGWVNIDGEGEEIGQELHFRNNPKSLKIIAP